ncbi:MAG: hypothetical protein M3O31_12870 [Acidobacteriota bacterium]|nr:hypothetical protein [Acidobacteriota bacterium]
MRRGTSTPISTGGGTSTPNYTACSAQQVPNWRTTAFQSNYQAALQQLISHYGSNPSIGYIRVGLGRGGEINLPQGWNDSTSGACYRAYTTTWGYTAGADATFTWNAYLQSMVQYEGTLASPKQLLVSITPVTGTGILVDDFMAPIAVASGLSFGAQGLQASDISNYPNCGADWCNLFARFPNTPVREMQTLAQSCPVGTTCVNSLSSLTGPLDPLIPFALAHGSNDLEIYYQDWLIAYDSAYASSVGASSSSAAYQAAIKKAVGTSGVTVQLLFPPQVGNPDYPAVQQYLMTNPAVIGVVIDIDWSDIDIGNASAGTHSSYSFAIPDAVIQPWIAAGKTVNIVFQNTTYGGGSNCPATGFGSNGSVGSNCAMPPWMWTALSH